MGVRGGEWGVGGSFPGQVMASVSRNVSVKKLEPPKREIFDQVSRGLNLSSCLKMQKYLDSSFENSPCSLSSLVLSRRSSRKTLIVVAIFQRGISACLPLNRVTHNHLFFALQWTCQEAHPSHT